MDIRTKRQKAANAVYILTAVIVVAIMCMTLFAAFGSLNKREDDGNEAVTSAPFITAAPDSSAQSESVIEPIAEPDIDVSAETEAPAEEVIAESSAEDISASAEYDTPMFTIPCSGTISKEFDDSVPVYSLTMGDYRVHSGVDIASEMGNAVYACSDGVVSEIYDDPYMGKCVSIDHGNEIFTLYAGVSETLPEAIAVGTAVKCGDIIAAIGEGGVIEMADAPHLHFELSVAGVPVDPLEYVPYEVGQEVLAYEDQ